MSAMMLIMRNTSCLISPSQLHITFTTRYQTCCHCRYISFTCAIHISKDGYQNAAQMPHVSLNVACVTYIILYNNTAYIFCTGMDERLIYKRKHVQFYHSIPLLIMSALSDFLIHVKVNSDMTQIVTFVLSIYLQCVHDIVLYHKKKIYSDNQIVTT